MKVTLINWTQLARETLIFTKSTRLNMTPGLWDQVQQMPEEQKARELEYMSNTIPSSWEFVDYIFLIEGVSRAFTHQVVRTRHGSYAQQTMRIIDVSGFDYVTGPSIKNEGGDQLLNSIYSRGMEMCNDIYKLLIARGAAVEDARGILPTNICTNIVCKFNLRTMSELARTRVGGRTQDEYRAVMAEMVACILGIHPWAEQFLFPKGIGFFDELEEFARTQLPAPLRPALLKIIDKMRKRND